MLINIKIDNKNIKAFANETILKTAIRLNIDIPHLCTNNFFKSNFNKCSMCLVEVKTNDENNNEEYKKVFACEEIVEENMIILNEKSEFIKKYRSSILSSILSTHTPVCENCNVYTTCKLKDYFNKYEIKNNETVKKTENKIIENRLNKKLLEEIEMTSNYERCIECGMCKTYNADFMIENYKTRIFDLCPTKVFLPNKLIDTDFNKIKKEESYCIDCENICECIVYLKEKSKEVIMLSSRETSKYGICDFAFHIKSSEKLSPLIYPLKNGFEEKINKARELYNIFFTDFAAENIYAFISSYFPKEDIEASEEEIKRLNIENYFFENIKINTDSYAKKRNMSNYNYILHSKEKVSENFFKNDYPKNSIFFIVASPTLLKDSDFINFTERESGNYIIFTSYHSEASRLAYLSFPIKMYGEFSGEYIDKNRTKKILNFENKHDIKNTERYSLRDIFNFLKS